MTAQCRRGELSQQLGRAPNASEIAEHLCIDREWVIEATIAGANYSTLSTDRQPGPDDEFQSIGDTLGDVDPGLDKVLDVATARPLIAALPGTATNRPYPPILRRYDPKPIAERMGYSQMHISRLLAKALDTLRINPSFSRLAEPRGSGGPLGPLRHRRRM